MPDSVEIDIGTLVAAEATKLIGAPSAHHSVWGLTAFVPNSSLKAGDILFTHTNRYRTPPSHIGIYDGKGSVIHSPGIEGSEVKKVSIEDFTAQNNVLPFYGGVMAAKRLK